MASAAAFNINFDKEKDQIESFLTSFSAPAVLDIASPKTRRTRRAPAVQPSGPKYPPLLQEIANRKLESIWIELDDVKRTNLELCKRILENTKRYQSLFSLVVDKLMPPATIPISDLDNVLDIIIEQRQQFESRETDDGSGPPTFPPALKRRFTLFFAAVSGTKAQAVRDIKSAEIGHMVSISGIVTRASDVKPLLTICTYSCDECGHEIFQEVASRAITPLSECQSPVCMRNRSRGKLHMQARACKFLRFQELRLQELADQVPMGHIPRSMIVHLYEGMTRRVTAGDIVQLAGVFLPTPYVGYRAIRAGLLADTYLEAMHVQQMKKSYDSMRAETPATAIGELTRRIAGLNLYEVLSRSICPEIYGHEDVKKALLLQLVGGVTKQVGDGMRIRGDINVLLMGDPGVAKSQLLKWVSKTAPRGVYTTGKGSSGVGLTAAVLKDSVTGEMVLEGGALVLADNGICCIDEFDKMEDGDKTAIHEVMEQQTISISKAGIVTTLNARASVLAAANPVYGRYNTSLTPIQNMNLPAALLSRFDIVFLLLDTANLDTDTRLAQHVTHVHRTNAAPATTSADISMSLNGEELRAYISHARTMRPTVSTELAHYLTNIYVGLRREEAQAKHHYGYTTARSLVSVIRMAQALARLRFAETVSGGDVDEAVRLMGASKQSLHDRKSRKYEHPVTRIFNLLKELAAASAAAVGGDGEVDLVELRERVVARGMTDTQLEETLREYADLGVVFVSADRTRVRWVQ